MLKKIPVKTGIFFCKIWKKFYTKMSEIVINDVIICHFTTKK